MNTSLDPNLAVQWDPTARTLHIRQSAISSFLDCRNKFYYEYVLGLEPDYPEGQRPWSTADTGTLMHEALGAHYLGESWGQAMLAYVSEQGFDLKDPAVAKAHHLVEVMVDGHLRDLAEDGADIGETTIGVEVPVEATFHNVKGVDVTVHGRVDRLIETDDGIKIIDDWKSVGPLTSTLDHITQLMRYAIMIRDVRQWRADRVRTTQLRKLLRTKSGPFYSRLWVPVNEAMYQEHYGQMLRVLSDIVGLMYEGDRSDYYRHVTTECGWKCRVKDLCIAEQHGDDPEVMVDLYYRKKGSNINE